MIMQFTIEFIIYLCIILILYRGFENNIFLITNLNWIKKSLIKEVEVTNYPEFIICIPALNEQRIIESTLDYFDQLNYPKDKYKVIISTTQKEISQVSIKSTLSIVNSKIHEINNKNNLESFSTIDYPFITGLKAHQVNYVISKIKENNNKAIFVLYDADSRPHKDTLLHVAFEMENYFMKYNKQANIVQQSSLFTLNYNSFKNNIEGYILKANALFQTKWTLVREITYMRSQNQSLIKPKKNILDIIFRTKLTHCVGHGLFVRISELESENALPTETINEDLPFGFYKCCQREPVLSIAILENSETPNSIKNLLNQKKVWFWPYFEYLKCRNIVLEKQNYFSELEVNILTTQAIFNGIVWFFYSIVFIAPIFLNVFIFHSLNIFLLWIITMLIYWFIPVSILYSNINRLENWSSKTLSSLSLVDFIITSLSGIIIIITHSIGPFLCLIEYLQSKFFSLEIIKNKTER